jgi:predicted Holliday junction resolvase-like endonuclease
VTRGQVFEQFAAYFPGFDFNPKDAQFLGKPVDFVVFDGLDEGELRRIVFVEIKTGNAALTARERKIREAIDRGDVEWRELRLGGDGARRVAVTRT